MRNDVDAAVGAGLGHARFSADGGLEPTPS
jgi:hypothetical protein